MTKTSELLMGARGGMGKKGNGEGGGEEKRTEGKKKGKKREGGGTEKERERESARSYLHTILYYTRYSRARHGGPEGVAPVPQR